MFDLSFLFRFALEVEFNAHMGISLLDVEILRVLFLIDSFLEFLELGLWLFLDIFLVSTLLFKLMLTDTLEMFYYFRFCFDCGSSTSWIKSYY